MHPHHQHHPRRQQPRDPAKGHRIRVEISSSWFPYYLRNLNTGADNIGLETTSVIAKQTIMHDAKHPSHVVLPVIPKQ